ncbi:MAG: TlpA disulfide reductase family protein [Acidobacteria bacterium]|nr:TlpA disulfide reductase family protein [Acidobacteriota bacterium]
MVRRLVAGIALAGGVALGAACNPAPMGGEPAASAPAEAAPGAPTGVEELVGQLRDMAWAGQVDQAQALIETQRPHHDTGSPDWLLAASWLGRGASFAERWDVAERYANEARDGSVALLARRDLDADAQLPLALGAGIEVLGQAMQARGDREGAIQFLGDERARYRGTSIETRIQKNALLVGLEGEPFPELDVDEHLGPALPSTDSLKGKVVVAFFWAHWCPDCKRQLPALEQLHDTYGDQVAIIGPTQLYGYISRGEDATPEQELAYLRGPYQERFPLPDWMSVPISQQNFLDFGVSTTPTLVVIDREGIVRLYNPGDLSYEELAPQVERLLSQGADDSGDKPV